MERGEEKFQPLLPSGSPGVRIGTAPSSGQCSNGTAGITPVLLGLLQFDGDAPRRERDLLFANRMKRGL